jgi:hypothetical protein
MYLNTLEVTLTPRATTDSYNLQLNQAAFDILALIFEFKVVTAWQIARFLTGKDQSKYLYLKLRRMWQAGLLESFKVYAGSRAGMPVYYVLSKSGLKTLAQRGRYGPEAIKSYPQPKTLFSLNIFRHEAQIVELASQEVKNGSSSFKISFVGELGSMARDMRSDKSIEVFTPDYTAFYGIGDTKQRIYTEFERTNKSVMAMHRKLDRYVRHLDPGVRTRTTLRFIFQNPHMEQAFWRNAFIGQAGFLQKLRVLTTNLTLLPSHERFLEPVYSSEQTAKLIKQGSLDVDLSQRIKLFSFL